jgi:hypothetical protein
MKHLLILGLMMSLASACGSSTTTTDAPNNGDAKVYMDGSGSGSGNVCTGALYDPCNTASSNCMTGLMCKQFTGSSFTVCTQTCSGTCPGTGAVCNNMGICKPAAPNNCTAP